MNKNIIYIYENKNPEWEKQFITWEELYYEWKIRKKIEKSFKLPDNINFMLSMEIFKNWSNYGKLFKKILLNGRHHGVYISIYFWNNNIYWLNFNSTYHILHKILTPEMRNLTHDIIIDPKFSDKKIIKFIKWLNNKN